MIIEFRNDEGGYRLWIEEHRGGYVVNALGSGRSVEPVLHKASCWTINDGPSRAPIWTGEYIKLCSEERDELRQWAVQMKQRQLKECAWCRP